MHNGSDYGLKEITAEAAQSILEFADKRLPVHHADADEPIDPLELPGFSAVRQSVSAEVTECLGFACPVKSDVCGQCKIARNTDEDDEDWVFDIIFRERSMPSFAPVFQSRHDALFALCEGVTTSRGGRSYAEAAFFKRMGI